MASLNPIGRELLFKIVFYGPGLGGKTTTLQHVHDASKPEHRGKMVSISTETDRTLYFDFLPLDVLRLKNLRVRLQLYTVPGQVYYAGTRKLVLSGADGIVFVADSQSVRLDANIESLDDLNANLAEQGRKLSEMPHTFQWNKRDLTETITVGELDRRLNLFSAPATETVATRGEGVFAGLETITKLVFNAYRADSPRARFEAPSLVDAEEAGLSQAIRDLADSQPLPPSPPPITPEPAAVRVPRTDAAASPRPPPLAPVPAPRRASQPELQPTLTPALASAAGFSLAELWPAEERDAVLRAEVLLASGDATNAVLACEVLVTRALAVASVRTGTSADQARDPALLVLLLGLDGRRYVRFRMAVRAARNKKELSPRDAREAYLFALEARNALDRMR